MKEREKERAKKPDEVGADEAAMAANQGQSRRRHHDRFLGLQSGRFFCLSSSLFPLGLDSEEESWEILGAASTQVTQKQILCFIGPFFF